MNEELNESDRDRLEGNICDPSFALNQVILGRHLFERVDYRELNPFQKQAYNRQKASAVLADFGFETQIVEESPGGADLIVYHQSGESFNVRVRPRPGFWREHLNRRIVICCRGEHEATWYLYPHDILFSKARAVSQFDATEAWVTTGKYHFPPPFSAWLLDLLKPYRLSTF